MIRPTPTARNIVRGFPGTPVTSGDEDSDYGGATGRATLPKTSRRGRPRIDDVVSANCSPVLRPTPSPSVSGIAKLRMQMDPLSLDAASRSSSTTRLGCRGPDNSRMSGHPLDSRAGSRDGAAPSEAGSEGSETASTEYEVNLEHDFVSESVRDRTGIIEGGLRIRRKMTAEAFEPLRCLGKGTYGTVLLVKQRATGKLYAQKQLKKASLVVHRKLVEQTKTERQILESVNRHPFVVKLFYAFQDHEKLYLILEYGQGGELFTHLSTEKMFSETVAAFYMAEMLLAISHLHTNLGVVYRDLKPENCLLDADGHLLLTDFGLSKVSAHEATDSCHSFLGTVEYMAPEVILGKKYGKAVDWWSFGALGYDLMTGNPPFRGQNHAKIQDNIVKQKLSLPYFLSADAKDLLTRLLRKDPNKRLGSNMPKDLQTLKGHRFFRKIDWKRLAARDLTPPIQPLITDPELAENFAPEFTDLALSPSLIAVASHEEAWSAVPPSAKDDVFGGFSFVASASLLESHAFPLASGVSGA
ncbi:serine/threonine-protein kinase psk1 [Cordyceps militaris CM01]|uniref:Serine/threonine-protein kinase psk1 n=2 Tax=Cordyceps militaris TaxID=73501 RepID=G3JIZ3_CORMM|nr:serine/threonine-protein kinase psk1 [Cordyceps militaris CM01]ATY59414.1 serine threonine-kinase psk1 [Cordyceps militaris]EGX91987.1 serine/threonine-protein kinase psk1 [Cordyceps militaris CM01]